MTSFLFETPRKASIFIQDNPLQLLEFDASVKEVHSGDVVITDHPVEEGSDISDHVRRNPEVLSVEGIVSNHPPIIARSIRATPSIPGGDPASRAEDAYGFLKELKDGAVFVGFSTTLRDYENMVIQSISIERSKDTGNIADLSIVLREVIVAQTETVAAPDPVNPARKKSSSLGKKPKVDATPATAAKTDSLLGKIFSAFGG